MPTQPDNFFQEEEQKAEEALEKIKIGETEYEPKEIESFIEKGKKVDEFAKKYNTDPDKAWSAYGKVTQENKAIKEELETLRQAATAQPQSGELTVEQIQQAKAQLEKILGGRVIIDKELDERIAQREAGKELLTECKGYEKEIDGTDGRPKFDTTDLLQYMQETGIRKPMQAYKLKYESELDAWKQNELNKERGSNLPTLSTPSTKEPKRVAVTKDNIGDLIREQLNQGQ
jgi:hypothetical protein